MFQDVCVVLYGYTIILHLANRFHVWFLCDSLEFHVVVSDTHTGHMNIYHIYASFVCVSQDVLFCYLILTLVTRICTTFMLHSFVSLKMSLPYSLLFTLVT